MVRIITPEVIQEAIKAGDLQKLRSFKKNVDFSSLRDFRGSGPLIWAISVNIPEVVSFFLNETDIDINETYRCLALTKQVELTALAFAVDVPGRMNIVKLLLGKKEINTNAKLSSGSALEHANEEYVQILKTGGAEELPLTSKVLKNAIAHKKKWIIDTFIRHDPSKISSENFMDALKQQESRLYSGIGMDTQFSLASASSMLSSYSTETVAYLVEKLLHGSFERFLQKTYSSIDFEEFFHENPSVGLLLFLDWQLKATHCMKNPHTAIVSDHTEQSAQHIAVLLRRQTHYGEQKEESSRKPPRKS